jgi:hypothetical protein
MANSTPNQQVRPFDALQGAKQHLAVSGNKAPDGFSPLFYWRRVIGIGDFTADAALSQVIDLHDDLTTEARRRKGQSGLFPGNAASGAQATGNEILMSGAYLRVITAFSGGGAAAVAAELGGTFASGLDDDGLITTTSVFTGASTNLIATPTAAEYALHPESGFVPELTLTADVNIDTLTAGSLEVVIMYYLTPRDT